MPSILNQFAGLQAKPENKPAPSGTPDDTKSLDARNQDVEAQVATSEVTSRKWCWQSCLMVALSLMLIFSVTQLALQYTSDCNERAIDGIIVVMPNDADSFFADTE